MQGHYEESPEVKARRALFVAAKKYVSAYLVDMFGQTVGEAMSTLERAAVEYAATQHPAPKKRTRAKR